MPIYTLFKPGIIIHEPQNEILPDTNRQLYVCMFKYAYKIPDHVSHCSRGLYIVRV